MSGGNFQLSKSVMLPTFPIFREFWDSERKSYIDLSLFIKLNKNKVWFKTIANESKKET